MKVFIWMYRTFFCTEFFYTLNLRVFDLVLRGIGILNYEGYKISGEEWFVSTFLKDKDVKIVIDVGANSDPYGMDSPEIQVFALEPNLSTYQRLVRNTKNNPNIHCFQLGLSNIKGKADFYDIPGKGSAHATLNKVSIEKFHKVKAKKSQISLITLDEFMMAQKIKRIDLLKIDTEGNEYKVLQGAKKALSDKKIRMILFEFNEMNVYGRVFMKDFYEILQGYSFYRLLPNGLGPLGNYRPITHELYAFQNIVAIRDE